MCDTDIYALSSSSKKVLGPIMSIVALFKIINTFVKEKALCTGYALLSVM